jgi:Cu2+-exporting ATPase
MTRQCRLPAAPSASAAVIVVGESTSMRLAAAIGIPFAMWRPDMSAAASETHCLHCGSVVPAHAPHPDFCCRGCHAVYDLLVSEGLTRFYDLQSERAPVVAESRVRDLDWLDPLLARAESGSPSLCTLELDVQGVHCAGCVWLMEELCRRQGGAAVVVNPALGKLRLSWRAGFDARAFVASVERFGYRFGTDRKRRARASSELTLRLGITAALTIHVMLFSFSFYSGLGPSDGLLFALFGKLVLILSTMVVLVGGSVFFRAAWRGLRAGLLHLDLPIAVGILLAWGASLVQARGGRGDHAYFDTLCVFVTLMLVGRWLQERLLERNRRFLLEDDAVDGLTARRREGYRLVTVDAARLAAGDVVVVAPGALVPVDGTLIDRAAGFTTDWVSGEPDVRAAAAGDVVPAGACNAGRSAFAILARTGFAESPLPRLLRAGTSARGTAHTLWWSRIARGYVLTVLALAATALAVWWPRDPRRAVDVTVALLVVTCPCAIGIAGPMAYELALGRLRRRGLFVRSGDLLDKLTRVRKLVFDKTGTLTLGRLELVGEAPLAGLTPLLRDAAYDMAARSNHPVSRCLAEWLAGQGARFSDGALVSEEPGRGLRMARDGHEYRLGAASFAAPAAGSARGVTVLSVDGAAAHAFLTRESLRVDAREELARLQAAGCAVWLLSGDAPERVRAVAAALGIPEAHAHGALSPDAKAALVAQIDREDTLYLGDGVNDALAFSRALCAGTPAIDRPVLPGRSDFFLLGDGIGALGAALRVARRLRATIRRNLALAIAYNAVTVTACFAGVMTPVRAAVAMPLSSLSILALTVASLSERSWRS